MAKAKVTITATNQMSKGIRSAQQELTNFEKVVDKVGSTLKTAFSVAAITVATKALVNAAKQCTEAYKTQLEAETKLENALKATGKQYEISSSYLKNYAKQLQSTTRFGDEAVLETEALLVATEKLNKDGLEKTLALSADLAEAMGTDMKSAAQTLSKVLQDPTKGLDRLKTIGISFTAQEKEQINALAEANELYKAQDVILEKVQGKYGGLAAAIASTPTGTLDKISNVIGDIKEDLGKGIVNSLAPAFDWILKMLQKIETWANQIAQKSEFRYSLNQGVAGNTNLLANNFTTEYLREEISKRNDTLFDSLISLEENYWLNAYLKKGNIGLQSFLEMQQDEQIELLNKLSNNDSLFVSDVMGQLVTYNKAFQEIMVLNEAIAKQDAKLQSSINEYWESIRGNAGSVSFSATSGVNLPQFNWEEGVSRHMFQLNFGAGGSPSLEAMTGRASSSTLTKAIENMAEYDPREFASAGIKELMRQKNPLVTFFADINSHAINLATGAPGGSPTLDAMFGRNGNIMLGNAIANRQAEDLRTDFQKLLDKFGTNEQQSAFGNTVLNSALSNIGEAGNVISKLATNMASMGPLLGAIATALEYVLQGFGQVLRPILDEVITYGLEPLREIGRVLADLIKPLLEELMPLFRDSADSFIGAINMVGQALAPVIRLITTVISPILSQLCNTLKMIEPVISVVAKVIAWLAGTITYVVEIFQHIGATILNWIAGFHIGNWRPFEGIRVEDKGMPGSYDSYIKSYMNGIDNASTLSVNDASTQTAVSSAAYRGATSVTINIYAEGPLVGDGGMRQFAQMIREEFDALNYYGVTA